MKKRSWVLLAGGAVLAAVLGAGVVMAQDGGSSSAGQSFLDRVAQKLGIDTPKLQQAITDARNDQINEAVQNGNLTQEQADKLRQRLDELPQDAPFPFKDVPDGGRGFAFKFGFGGPGRFGFGFGGQDLADYLGISQDQLMQELQADGATLAKVAEAHGKSRDDLKSHLLDPLNKKVDNAVANGDLTKERGDQIKQQASSHIDQLIDNTFPLKGRFHFHGDHGDENQEQEGTSTSAFRS
jgi:uncharacterized protein YidB (DUF937 family)